MPDPYKRNPVKPNLTEARFYCEHCSHEVPFNAEICPHCKRTFSSVKCPQCGFASFPDKFLNGCPHCGFISNRSSIGRKRASTVEGPRRSGPKSMKKHDLFTPLALIGVGALLVAIIFIYMTKN